MPYDVPIVDIFTHGSEKREADQQKKEQLLGMIPDIVKSNNLNVGEEQTLVDSVLKTGQFPPMLATGNQTMTQPAGPPTQAGMLPSPVSQPEMIPTATMRTQVPVKTPPLQKPAVKPYWIDPNSQQAVTLGDKGKLVPLSVVTNAYSYKGELPRKRKEASTKKTGDSTQIPSKNPSYYHKWRSPDGKIQWIKKKDSRQASLINQGWKLSPLNEEEKGIIADDESEKGVGNEPIDEESSQMSPLEYLKKNHPELKNPTQADLQWAAGKLNAGQ